MILSKIGISNLPVIMQLINSYCMSRLLYNLEIFELTKSNVNNLLFTTNRLYLKICKTSNIYNIKYCLYCLGQLPLDILLLIRKCLYLNGLLLKSDIVNTVFKDIILTELKDTIGKWKSFGLSYPCTSEGWILFEKLLFDV